MRMDAINRYFVLCLSCCMKKKKSRKEIRAEWNAGKAVKKSLNDDEKKNELISPPQSRPSSAAKPENNANQGYSDATIRGITKLQAAVRGFLGKLKAFLKWQEALEEANQYWLYQKWLKDEEQQLKRSTEAARSHFVLQYLDDVFNTALLYVDGISEASTTIQKLWRGYRVRKIPKPVPPPPKKRLGKVVRRDRFSPNLLRRVWARKEYEPSNSTYLHSTDFGYLEYDMWEHIDKPPVGESVGLKNRQVRVPIKSEAAEIVLLHDRHAWVGLPISYQTTAERDDWAKATIPDNVKNMIANSPYKESMLSEQEKREFYTNSIPKVSKYGSKKKKSKSKDKSKSSPSSSPHQSMATATDSSTEDQISSPVPTTFGDQLLKSDKKQLKYLQKIGYNEQFEKTFRIPGMPRIGAKIYDPQFGHYLVYRGFGKWKRLATGEIVEYGALALKAKADNERSLPVRTMNSIATDDTSVIVPPTIYEQQDGNIVIHNQHFDNGGRNTSKTKSSSKVSSKRSKRSSNKDDDFLDTHERNFQALFHTGEEDTFHEKSLLGPDLEDFKNQQRMKREKLLREQQRRENKSNVLTTNEIEDSFLTTIRDTGTSADDGLLSPQEKKPIYMNEQTGTPFRGTTKVKYYSLQLKAKQQQDQQENDLKAGKITKKKKSKKELQEEQSEAFKAKQFQSQANRAKEQWHDNKNKAETFHNDTIRGHSVLSAQLGELIYQQDLENNSLFQSLLYEKSDLLESNRHLLKKRGQIAASASVEEPSLTDGHSLVKWTESIYKQENRDEDQALLQELNMQEIDDETADMLSVWKRSVFSKPNLSQVQSKVVVWNKPASQHYHLKYTWIPQPLVHNAAHELFYDRSYKQRLKETRELYAESKFTKKMQEKLEKDKMISIIEPGTSNDGKGITSEDSKLDDENRTFISSLASMVEDDDDAFFDPETNTIVRRAKPKKPQKKAHKTFISKLSVTGEGEESEESQEDEGSSVERRTAEGEDDEEGKDDVSYLSLEGSGGEGSYEEDSITRKHKPDSQVYRGKDLEEFTLLNEEPSMQTGISNRYTLSTTSVPFPTFLKGFKPKTLTKSKYILHSSTEKVTVNGETLPRKFQYRPVGRKSSKVNPEHPFEFY